MTELIPVGAALAAARSVSKNLCRIKSARDRAGELEGAAARFFTSYHTGPEIIKSSEKSLDKGRLRV